MATEGEGGDLIASFQQKRIQKIQLRNAWMWLPVNIQYPPPPSNLMIYFCLVFLDEWSRTNDAQQPIDIDFEVEVKHKTRRRETSVHPMSTACKIASLRRKADWFKIRIPDKRSDNSFSVETICLYRPLSPRFLRFFTWAFRRRTRAASVNHAPSMRALDACKNKYM